MTKKEIRKRFREAVLKRDGFSCVICGHQGTLDVHHITDRSIMPNGGYVLDNGITLCYTHHELAEIFHRYGKAAKGYAPDNLYKIIKSSYNKACKTSAELK